MAFRSFAGSSGPMHSLQTAPPLSPDTAISGGFSVGANIRSAVSPWVRFTWRTKSLPEVLPGPEFLDVIRPAEKEESGKVIDTIMHSLSMDSAWNDSLMKVEQYLREAVSRVFDQEEPLCLVIPKGNRFIAASLLDSSPEATNQLVSGPVVLVEYRNRSIGSRLLHASLLALRDRGLTSITGITRVNTVSSRHVYPKFGGIAESVQLPSQIIVSTETTA